MMFAWRKWRVVAMIVLSACLLVATVSTTFGGQGSSTDPDDLTAVAGFKHQRGTGTAVALTNTQTAAPRTATFTPSRTPTRGSATATLRSTNIGTPTTVPESLVALRLYAQSVLGLRVDVNDAKGDASDYLNLITTLPTAVLAHTSALTSAPKSYGGTINGGAALVSIGNSSLSGNLNADLVGDSLATYTLLVNVNGKVDTSTPNPTQVSVATRSSTTPLASEVFNPLGTLTALPNLVPTSTRIALVTPALQPTIVLNAVLAYEVARLAYPAFAPLTFKPARTNASSMYAWYALTTVNIASGETNFPKSVNQTVILIVTPGVGSKIQVSATIARGSYASFLTLP